MTEKALAKPPAQRPRPLQFVRPAPVGFSGKPVAKAAKPAAGRRHRDLIDTVDVPIFTIDLEGRLTSLNRAAERLTGHARADVLSQNVDALIPASALGLVPREGVFTFRRAGGVCRFAYDLVTRGGVYPMPRRRILKEAIRAA